MAVILFHLGLLSIRIFQWHNKILSYFKLKILIIIWPTLKQVPHILLNYFIWSIITLFFLNQNHIKTVTSSLRLEIHSLKYRLEITQTMQKDCLFLKNKLPISLMKTWKFLPVRINFHQNWSGSLAYFTFTADITPPWLMCPSNVIR